MPKADHTSSKAENVAVEGEEIVPTPSCFWDSAGAERASRGELRCSFVDGGTTTFIVKLSTFPESPRAIRLMMRCERVRPQLGDVPGLESDTSFDVLDVSSDPLLPDELEGLLTALRQVISEAGRDGTIPHRDG